MTRDDRRDATDEGVHGAYKGQEQCKGTEYIHETPTSSPRTKGVLHGAGRAGARLAGRRGGCATRSGFILRRALCLHVLGHKTAVRSRAAFDQRLRLIDERVWQ